MTPGQGNKIFFLQQLPILGLGPLKGFLSWHCALQGPLTGLVRCFQKHRETRPRQVCRKRRGGPRTLPSTIDANLDRAFVENAPVFWSSKDFKDPSLDLEARPSSPEGSGGVASGCSNGAECSVVEDEASIKCHCPLGFVGEKCQQGTSLLPTQNRDNCEIFCFYSQLSNLWWMPYSVSNVFGPTIRKGSLRLNHPPQDSSFLFLWLNSMVYIFEPALLCRDGLELQLFWKMFLFIFLFDIEALAV